MSDGYGYGFPLTALDLATEAASIRQQYKDLTMLIEEEHKEARAASFNSYQDNLDEARILIKLRSAVCRAGFSYTKPLIYVGVDTLAY